MPRETASLAILFADIAKSTNIYETLGDKIAQNIIGTCLSLLGNITQQHKGTVIKTIGDEIMCTFHTANEAVEAAKAMHIDMRYDGVDLCATEPSGSARQRGRRGQSEAARASA